LSNQLKPARDWFDNLWDQASPNLPIYLRGQSVKDQARGLVGLGIEALAQQAKTPEGIRQVVAFARIASIMRGAQNVVDAPDPTPEEVVEQVERLVKRVKP
jgi:hypothetical protein